VGTDPSWYLLYLCLMVHGPVRSGLGIPIPFAVWSTCRQGNKLMSDPALYTVREIGFDSFRVVKFDQYVNVLGFYLVWKTKDWECNCPQGGRLDCRHRIILRIFQRENRVNSGWLYDFDGQRWERPMNDPVRLLQQKAKRQPLHSGKGESA
jgi:hypothetical protein